MSDSKKNSPNSEDFDMFLLEINKSYNDIMMYKYRNISNTFKTLIDSDNARALINIHHEDPDIRSYCAYSLMQRSDKMLDLQGIFLDRLTTESNQNVKAELLVYIGNFLQITQSPSMILAILSEISNVSNSTRIRNTAYMALLVGLSYIDELTRINILETNILLVDNMIINKIINQWTKV